MVDSPVQLNEPPRGLALPARRVPGGYFSAEDEFDTAWGDLLIALVTPLGGRPMARTFGSGLSLLLFEPNTELVPSEAEEVIREAAAAWTPHIVIHGVRVESQQDGRLGILVAFGLTTRRESAERQITVRRDGGFDVLGSG